MEAIIIDIINKFGYIGIMLLIAIENIFPPIPSEVILTFAGFATTISKITILGTIVASTIGSVLGAIILYFIGRFLSEERIDKIVSGKLGKILGMDKEDIHKAFSWFESKGKYAVFFGRFIPIVRSLVSVPAGMSKMLVTPFLILTTVGSFIWNVVLIILGKVAGESWNRIASFIGGYSDIVLIGFIVVFVLGIVAFYLKKTGIVKIIRFKKENKKVNE